MTPEWAQTVEAAAARLARIHTTRSPAALTPDRRDAGPPVTLVRPAARLVRVVVDQLRSLIRIKVSTLLVTHVYHGRRRDVSEATVARDLDKRAANAAVDRTIDVKTEETRPSVETVAANAAPADQLEDDPAWFNTPADPSKDAKRNARIAERGN